MYRPLPDGLTIKNSPIEGLGLFSTVDIKINTFIGVTHIRDEQFDNKYIRTPLGGFYNHSNNPNVVRMISNELPKLKFGDIFNGVQGIYQIPEKDMNRETDTPKTEPSYMYLVSIRAIKINEEITANYNLYTYPKTGIGLQMI